VRHARLCQTAARKVHRNFSLNSCEFGKSLSQTEICNSSFIHKMRIMQEENGRRANITATVCPPLPLLSRPSYLQISKTYPFFLIVRSRRQPISRGASTRTPSNAAESPAHRNQASQETSASDIDIAPASRIRGSSWHVPKCRPQLARGFRYTYVPAFPKHLCSYVKTPNDSSAWRENWHVSLRSERSGLCVG